MSTGVRPDAGEAKHREARGYTQEQHKAVLRVMKCSTTSYYEILSVEKTCTDSQVKKAYRKLALVMHPDKNSAPQADEAFKRVSKAFQVLSDPDKKRIFDQTGSDPESRQGGFSSTGFNRGGGGFQQAEFDPNDIFNMFFGGGGPAGYGQSPFGGGAGGPQVFSFGGNTFQFGGNPFQQAGQRARQQAQGRGGTQEAPNWTQYVPFIGILIIMLLVQFFTSEEGSSSAAKMPRFSFDRAAPFTQERYTPNYKFQYFVNPREVKNTGASALRKLDRYAETTHIKNLRYQCDIEYDRRERALRDATGWFSRDEDAYQTAVNMGMPACERLGDMGLGFNHQ